MLKIPRKRQVSIIITSRLVEFKRDMGRVATLIDETSEIESDGNSLITMTWASDKSLILVKRRINPEGTKETYDIEYSDKGYISTE